ncbi:MAG: hypothetical protein ACXV3S_04450 [Kineosporiaceae bacterium]
MFAITRAVTLGGSALLAASLVAGCGGTASAGTGSSSGPTTAPTSSAGAGGAGAGPGGAQFAAIRSCLQAAGIPLPTPSARPSISRSPGEPRPSGPRPSGGFRGGRLFSDPKVQAALKACGITPPSPGSFRRPSGGSSGGSSASPTS